MELLGTYERIILGDLRPNLKRFNNKKGLKELEGLFYSFRWSKEWDPNTMDERLRDMIPSYKQGDTFTFSINQKSKTISVSHVKNPGEEDLINLDIAPPEDLKGEVYARIIEDQFARFKKTLSDTIKKAKNSEVLELFANQNILQAKKLAMEAHLFEKRLGSVNGKAGRGNGSNYVLYVLKKYLIYCIDEIQISFKPFLKSAPQGESELEDELYDFQATERRLRVEKLHEKTNKKIIERLHTDAGQDTSLIDKIQFFRNKVSIQLDYIKENSHRLCNWDIEKRDLLTVELGQLLSAFHTERLFPCEYRLQYKEDLDLLLIERVNLVMDEDAIDFKALSKTDFFRRLDLQIQLLKDILSDHKKAKSNLQIRDLIDGLLLIQGRKHWRLKENEWNDYLSDLLRFKNYNVSDQTRNGRSAGRGGTESGELDIAIRDPEHHGIVLSIVESFFIDSCGVGNKAIAEHIHKLIENYDTAGHRESFAVVFSRAIDFDKIWLNYKHYISSQVFNSEFLTEELSFDWLAVNNIKIGLTPINRRNGDVKKLYHVFVNMHSTDN